MQERRLVTEAARNNAEWCHTVCRSHGLPGVFTADAWSVPRRPPPMYPNAVTLAPGAAAPQLLDRIDNEAGVSVKDSFAALDLAPYGFQVLFEAEWIHREPGDVEGSLPGVDVTTAEGLAGWATAHGGGPVFRPAVLADPAVTVLALPGQNGEVAGGAVVNRSARVGGVSNLFAVSVAPADVWRTVCARFPQLPLVGYESGEDLGPARQLGFRTIGPLRVWLRP